MNIQRISHSQHNVHSQAYKPVVWEVLHFPTFPPRTSDVNGGWPWFVSYHKEVGNSSAAQNHGSRNTPSAVHLFPQPSVWPNEKGTWCVAPLSSHLIQQSLVGSVDNPLQFYLRILVLRLSVTGSVLTRLGRKKPDTVQMHLLAVCQFLAPWRVTAHQARLSRPSPSAYNVSEYGHGVGPCSSSHSAGDADATHSLLPVVQSFGDSHTNQIVLPYCSSFINELSISVNHGRD